FNRITSDRIEGRRKGDRLTVNRKHRLVTGLSGNFFNVLVIIPERYSKAIHFDAQPLLEQLLGADHFVLYPLLIWRPSYFRPGSFPAGTSQHDHMPFAQVLMRRRMRLNVHAVVA